MNHHPFLVFIIFCFFLFRFCTFLLSCDLDAAKLQPLMVEGGACNHSRLQRCIRKSRSLQQRMQQQQQQELLQKPRLPEQEEELQRRYQPISSS